jgi:hypothetical protein
MTGKLENGKKYKWTGKERPLNPMTKDLSPRTFIALCDNVGYFDNNEKSCIGHYGYWNPESLVNFEEVK